MCCKSRNILRRMQAIRAAWGARLRRAREARGLTQGGLARLVGVSVSTVSRAESGQFAVQDELKLAFARALAVDMNALWPWPALDEPERERGAPGGPAGGLAGSGERVPAGVAAAGPGAPERVPADNQPGVVTVRELAALLGMHPATLYAHLDSGDFPLTPLPLPGRRRFSRSQVERLLRGDDPA